MELKPQDVLVLLKQVATPDHSWTYATLGSSLKISASQVHRSVRRAVAAGLAISEARDQWRTVRSALQEFAVHGIRYAFPATVGAPQRGVPTAHGTPPLSFEISSAAGEAPVWAHPRGAIRGPTLSPLSPTAPEAALGDPRLHELLALIDALRIGRSRERSIAAKLLGERLRDPHAA